MSAEILQEYLVKFGFSHDEQGASKSIKSLESFALHITKLGVAAEAASVGVVLALEKMARGFEDAFFAASRAGSSVTELKKFEYAASQIGSTAEAARKSVEGLADKIRANPALAGQLKDKGVKDVDDKYKATEEFLDILDAMPAQLAKQQADRFSIDEGLWVQHRKHAEEFRKFLAEEDDKIRAMHLDPAKAAEDGRKLSQSFRDLGETFDLFRQKVGSDLFVKLQPGLDRLSDYIAQHGDKLAAVLEDIATALLQMFTGIVMHIEDVDNFAKALGGWTPVLTALSTVLALRVIPGLTKALGLLTALMGLPGFIGALAGGSLSWGEGHRSAQWDAAMAAAARHGSDALKSGESPLAPGGDKRSIWDKAKDWWSGKPAPAQQSKSGWWTPERQKYAYDKLTAQGVSALGAAALVSRWANVESTQRGPDAANNIGGGHFGIAQMSQQRFAGVQGDKGFDEQLAHVARELHGPEGAALKALNAAKTPEEAARGASIYERGEGYNKSTGTDFFTGKTVAGIRGVLQNSKPELGSPPSAMPSWTLNFDPGSYQNSFRTPLGAYGNDNKNEINVTPKTEINISGVTDPAQAASHAEDAMKRQHSSMLKSLQSVA